MARSARRVPLRLQIPATEVFGALFPAGFLFPPVSPEGTPPCGLEELAIGTLEARYEYFVNQFRAEGERKLLVRQLDRRFGPLPEWAEEFPKSL
jgi:hypothetical protein